MKCLMFFPELYLTGPAYWRQDYLLAVKLTTYLISTRQDSLELSHPWDNMVLRLWQQSGRSSLGDYSYPDQFKEACVELFCWSSKPEDHSVCKHCNGVRAELSPSADAQWPAFSLKHKPWNVLPALSLLLSGPRMVASSVPTWERETGSTVFLLWKG